MSDPRITIIGLGEDGRDGLSAASLRALDEADIIFGGPRHLELVDAGVRGAAWPVPFSIAPVLAHQDRRVVVLASGDPFWFGAGAMLAEALPPGAWVAHPAPSTFALVAAALGWRMEAVQCIGLHAAPMARLRPVLQDGARLICTMRDGGAPAELAAYLCEAGFGASRVIVAEAMGGPKQRVRSCTAQAFDLTDVWAPVVVAVEARGRGLPLACGLPDDLFQSDGQITKQPIRALTLSTLTPRAGEHLWDLGAGSGSISVECCLAGGGSASAVEVRADRAKNIVANAARFGLDHRIGVTTARLPAGLAELPTPDAVFIGGGAGEAMLQAVWDAMPTGARLLMNGVTLETEALLAGWHANHGGRLMQYSVAEAEPLGRMRGWIAARPVTQWSVVKGIS